MVARIVEPEDCVSPLIMAVLYMKGLPTHISPPLCETCLYFTDKKVTPLNEKVKRFQHCRFCHSLLLLQVAESLHVQAFWIEKQRPRLRSQKTSNYLQLLVTSVSRRASKMVFAAHLNAAAQELPKDWR